MRGLLLTAIAAVLLLTACTQTRYLPIEQVRTEQRNVIKKELQIDTVATTRFVFVKGDTVVDIRQNDRVRRVEIHDTIFIERTDSITVPVPVERPLTRWQQIKMDFGGMAIGALLGVLCAAVVWLILKFRK